MSHVSPSRALLLCCSVKVPGEVNHAAAVAPVWNFRGLEVGGKSFLGRQSALCPLKGVCVRMCTHVQRVHA